MPARSVRGTPRAIVSLVLILMLAAAWLGLTAARAGAAPSAACDGGGFTLGLASGPVTGDQKRPVPASALGTSFLVEAAT